MIKKIFIAAISCAFILSACTTPKNTESMTNPLAGVEWKLTSVKSPTSDDLIIPNGDRIPTLNFDATKNTISGFGGCNRLMGPYELKKGNLLKFGNVAATMMMCVEHMDLEQAFTKALENTDKFKIQNDQLMLMQGATVVATFSK